LVDEVLTSQISQMCSLFTVGQVCAYTPRHHHYERVLIHVEPIRAPDKLVVGVSNEWTLNIGRQIRLIEPWLDSLSLLDVQQLMCSAGRPFGNDRNPFNSQLR
jgi:hypothetical protein